MEYNKNNDLKGQYKELKTEVAKDAGKALFFFFVALPAFIYFLVWLFIK